MEKKIHLLKFILFCGFIGMVGCEKKEEPIVIDRSYIEQKTQDIMNSLIENNKSVFEDALFEPADKELPSFVGCSTTEEYRFKQGEDFYTTEQVVACDGRERFLYLRYNTEGLIEDWYEAELPPVPMTEETDAYEEFLLNIGNIPSVYGILTVPSHVESPPVIVLVAETFDASLDDSRPGDNFRKTLAHALAEKGIASVRYDTRLYQCKEKYPDTTQYNLNELFFEDFAYVVHHLDQYPVNASNIKYLGKGTGGYLGFTSLYHHFEITGGLIMLDPPSGTGIEVFMADNGIPVEVGREVADAIVAKEETLEDKGGYSYSYWKEWNAASAQKYLDNVRQRIVVLNTKEKDEEWVAMLKGKNAVVKDYPKLSEFMENGTFNEDVLIDIIDWIHSKDITKDVKKR